MNVVAQRLKKVFAFGALALAIGGVTTYAAVASIPDAQGIVHACRLNLTGAIRVIDTDSQSCIALTETAIQLSSPTSGMTASTYANRLSIDYDSQGSHTLATVPGFGTISAFPCTTGNVETMNGYWQFTNTSGQTMEYLNPANVTLSEIPTNGTILELTPHTVSVAPKTGSATKLATVLVHSYNDEANSKCHYRVVVTATL
ncbi:MAG TPA: hypothetical protein VJM32_06150 [Candidatus Saccharimonadales bacterium]|nr:hypothetical protein [Candidatus Saccharimonadales bacterium]